ncbi:nucleotidyltransferase [Pyrococcus furiosus DSM 3638]|uniref:Nucleotidyltransferase n=3 Tax=Pyrococcus furiosus TaxID=2261 RepID=A0A5C0XUR1_PYRFU|nr:hypothetical protein PF0840 [Pyrococcus furiosus DSM 3638]AFN03628.1 nucleotidyltransferase [Pyrococcus furiosus COM1]QEK78510.1 nucleotidyltransferase [Pyrococcus furiosus DSM 3638]
MKPLLLSRRTHQKPGNYASGRGFPSSTRYIEDVQWLLKEFEPFVRVSADLPFVKARDIALIRSELEKKKPASLEVCL